MVTDESSDTNTDRESKTERRSTIGTKQGNIRSFSKRVDVLMGRIETIRDNYLAEIKDINKISAGTGEMYSDMMRRTNPGLWSLANTFDKLSYVDRKLVKIK